MKKGQMPNWIVALLIAIIAGLLILFLYLSWKTKSTSGVGFIKSLMGEIKTNLLFKL